MDSKAGLQKNIQVIWNWDLRLIGLYSGLILYYFCKESNNVKIISFCIIELIGAVLLLIHEFRESHIEAVNNYNNAVFERISKNRSLRDKEELAKFQKNYPYAEINTNLIGVYSLCFSFITKVLGFKYHGVGIQLNGWPPIEPKFLANRSPILSTGYFLIIIAFILQLWYAIIQIG